MKPVARKRRAWLRAAALVGAVSVLALGAACNSEVECYPGDQKACFCDAGIRGYETCSKDGSGYGSCACEPLDGGVDDGGADGGETDGGGTDGGGTDGGLKMFMDLCANDKECETGLCFFYNAKPARCSKPCSATADCPPPSTGCNGMGVCKSP